VAQFNPQYMESVHYTGKHALHCGEMPHY
jgi:hypothetical protein